MELRRDVFPTVALAALSAAVAAGFARVFSGDAWLAPVLAAAIVPHLIGLLTRRRAVAVTVSAWALGLAVFAIWVLAPSSTRFGVPTGSTLHELTDRLDHGLRVLRDQSAPVPPHSGAVLLAAIAVWIMAAFADHLAFRRDATIGAIAPGITLFIWIAALAPGADSHVAAAAAVVITGSVFLALQHQLLLGRRRNAVGAGGPLPAPRLVGGALALGVVAAIVAVAVAPALPGAGADPLIDLRNDDRASSTYQTSVPPLVDVADSLRRGEEIEVFTVSASAPEYWRTVALDEYSRDDGGQWTLRASGGDITRGLDGPVPLAAVEQQFRITALGERWMPAAYAPVKVTGAEPLVVSNSLTLVADADALAGLRYRVASAIPVTNLTEAQRRATAVPVPNSYRVYTQLPKSVPDEIGALALSVTAGATNAYDKATKLRDFFRSGSFTYDPDVDLDDQIDATVQFLRERRGFCVQFASTYALMARSLGIPTRVAVGFTPGKLDATTGRYSVTNYQAHAWPEVWLEGVGWTNQFEPTPPSNEPGGSDLPGDTSGAVVPPAAVTPSTTIVTAPPSSGVPAPDAPAVTPPAAVPTGTDASGGRSWAATAGILVVIVLLIGAALAVVPARKLRRRRARRQRSDPAARVAGAWEEAIDRLREIGQNAPRAETPSEMATAAEPAVGAPAASALREVADMHTAAQFGAGPVAPGTADRAWQQVDEFSAELGQHLGLRARLRARLAVAPLRRPSPSSGAQPETVGVPISSGTRSSSTND